MSAANSTTLPGSVSVLLNSCVYPLPDNGSSAHVIPTFIYYPQRVKCYWRTREMPPGEPSYRRKDARITAHDGSLGLYLCFRRHSVPAGLSGLIERCAAARFAAISSHDTERSAMARCARAVLRSLARLRGHLKRSGPSRQPMPHSAAIERPLAGDLAGELGNAPVPARDLAL